MYYCWKRYWHIPNAFIACDWQLCCWSRQWGGIMSSYASKTSKGSQQKVPWGAFPLNFCKFILFLFNIAGNQGKAGATSGKQWWPKWQVPLTCLDNTNVRITGVAHFGFGCFNTVTFGEERHREKQFLNCTEEINKIPQQNRCSAARGSWRLGGITYCLLIPSLQFQPSLSF